MSCGRHRRSIIVAVKWRKDRMQLGVARDGREETENSLATRQRSVELAVLYIFCVFCSLG